MAERRRHFEANLKYKDSERLRNGNSMLNILRSFDDIIELKNRFFGIVLCVRLFCFQNLIENQFVLGIKINGADSAKQTITLQCVVNETREEKNRGGRGLPLFQTRDW